MKNYQWLLGMFETGRISKEVFFNELIQQAEYLKTELREVNKLIDDIEKIGE